MEAREARRNYLIRNHHVLFSRGVPRAVASRERNASENKKIPIDSQQ